MSVRQADQHVAEVFDPKKFSEIFDFQKFYLMSLHCVHGMATTSAEGTLYRHG